METENSYQILPTEDGRFLLVIKSRPSKVEEPYIVYAKGKHAVLYRNKNKEEAIILDFLAPESQQLMADNKRAIIIEIENEAPVLNYIAEIQLRDKLPVKIQEE